MTPESVNYDMVDSVMECAGYRRSLFTVASTVTVLNLGLAAVFSWAILPEYGFATALVILFVLGICVFHLVAVAEEWRERTLQMRNALERRLGLPEYARHREGYSPEWQEWI